jgi:hypothetical protein
MAFLRAFSDIDKIHTNKIPIKDGEQYDVAKKLFEENRDIMYFYYFNDDAEQNNRFYTYPIQRHSIELHFRT